MKRSEKRLGERIWRLCLLHTPPTAPARLRGLPASIRRGEFVCHSSRRTFLPSSNEEGRLRRQAGWLAVPEKRTTPPAALLATATGGEWPPEGGRGPRHKPGSDPEGGHERPAALRPDRVAPHLTMGLLLRLISRCPRSGCDPGAECGHLDARSLVSLCWSIPFAAPRPTLRGALLKNRREKYVVRQHKSADSMISRRHHAI